MAAAVTFEQVSKRYRGARTYRSLREDLSGAFRARPARSAVQAVENLSFSIPEGQSVALLGLNGAGKTTALKLLCRIAYPSAGRISVAGRIGALIEVGTGMHPELSGRENVRLYGKIMGLSSRDIHQRFDDIVEFAGVGAAIDRQVKQYSSGMQLRLGFSIAAHLDPEIFVVDEAISVGDAGFQNRCVERMMALSREGRTLIFVSHDLSAVETLCERALLLKSGRLVADGPAPDVVRTYLDEVHAEQSAGPSSRIDGDGLVFEEVSVVDEAGRPTTEVVADHSLTVRIRYRADRRIESPMFSVGITEGSARALAIASMLIDGESPDAIEGAGTIECKFLSVPLQARNFDVWGSVRGAAGYGDIIDWQRLCTFKVLRDVVDPGKGSVVVAITAPVRLPYEWRTLDGGPG
jgi:ABC-type polysaccharide/polyol phosphate transport system ATPase subunit